MIEIFNHKALEIVFSTSQISSLMPIVNLMCFSSKVTKLRSVHLVASKYFINWNEIKIGSTT